MGNDPILDRIKELNDTINAHIDEQRPFFECVRVMMQELGDEEQVRTRRIFVEALMKRESERAELRRAVIKHGTVVAAMSVLYFLLRGIWREVVEIARGVLVK